MTDLELLNRILVQFKIRAGSPRDSKGRVVSIGGGALGGARPPATATKPVAATAKPAAKEATKPAPNKPAAKEAAAKPAAPPAAREAAWKPAPDSAFKPEMTSKVEMDKWGNAAYKKWAETTPAVELDAVAHYTGSGYGMMNRRIREGAFDPNSGQFVDKQINLVNAALNRGSLPEGITAFRGIKDYHSLGIADPASLKVGSEIKESAFASTSLARSVVHENYTNKGIGTPMLMQVQIPKGSKGVYINAGGDTSSHPYEKEFLLPMGTKYRVTGVGKTPDGVPLVNVQVVN